MYGLSTVNSQNANNLIFQFELGSPSRQNVALEIATNICKDIVTNKSIEVYKYNVMSNKITNRYFDKKTAEILLITDINNTFQLYPVYSKVHSF